MKKEMLINVLQPEECRIAIVEDGLLEELYVERSSQESYVGNIYKGRIVNIEPSIQAAFVDFGIGRNGFLHVSDVDPAYYKHLLSKADLAEYEAEMNREYGGGSRERPAGRDRDRTPRARPMTSWLESQQPAPPLEGPEADDFATGITEDIPTAEPIAETVAEEMIEAAEVVHPTPTDVNDEDFGAGLDVGSLPASPPVQPPPLPRSSVECFERTNWRPFRVRAKQSVSL